MQVESKRRYSPEKEDTLYRRIILTCLIIAAGGMIAFIVWTYPSLRDMPSQGAIYRSYAIAFVPTLLMMVALLLGCIAWWVALDNPSRRKSAYDLRQNGPPYRKGSDQGAAAPLVKVVPLKPHARKTSVTTLRDQRKRHLYAGRHYRGKARQIDLALFTPSRPSLIDPSSMPLPTFDIPEGQTSPSQILTEEDNAFAPALKKQPRSQAVDTPVPDAQQAAFLPVSQNTEAIPEIPTPITIFLLKELTVELQNSNGQKKTVPLLRKRREDGRYIERDLFAYLAALRGQAVGRDKLFEEVFKQGRPDITYNISQLASQFNKYIHLIRKDINQAAAELGLPELTIITSQHNEWHLLTDECRVVDLDEVDRLYARIALASGELILVADIQDACQALINRYRGDFLEHYVEDTVREDNGFWTDSWMREPYTSYRDKYFRALWYRAEYWRIKGDACTGTSEAERALQRDLYEQATKLYQLYALHVPSNFNIPDAMLFDLKVKQRIGLAEQALHACLDIYTVTKNIQAGDAFYLSFARRMGDLTQGQWRPQAETVEAWKNLREPSNAHHFSPAVIPHDV